ncbi:MAG: aldose 1-epimerase family protein [Acidobacteriota bacterium]
MAAPPALPGTCVLEDAAVRAEIAPQGAEPTSLRLLDRDVEFLWQGDPAYWGRQAPLLFPIVGRLHGDRYTWMEREYHLPQHGFARDLVFRLIGRGGAWATFELRESDETLENYPFEFRLAVTHRVAGGSLRTSMTVDNPGDEPLPFSIGAHPGFRCPLRAGEALDAYTVRFEEPETADRLIVEDGLIGAESEPFLRGEREVRLSDTLFDRGALVFSGLRSDRVRLAGPGGSGVELTFTGFPYFGIWSKPGAPFVCLEPWCGIADRAGHDGDLAAKEGLIWLPPGGRFAREISIRPL